MFLPNENVSARFECHYTAHKTPLNSRPADRYDPYTGEPIGNNQLAQPYLDVRFILHLMHKYPAVRDAILHAITLEKAEQDES